jgi:multidrug transporter EmrE-like cation transporter
VDLPVSGERAPATLDRPPWDRRGRMILALIVGSVALAAVGQLTLKYGMTRVGPIGGEEVRSPVATVLRVAREPAVWAGLGMFGISAIAWMVVLSRVPLSFAYPFAAITYVMILLFDHFVLKEPVAPLRWGGVACIVAGLFLISRTGNG